jgi:hypothetical protein
VAVPFLAAEPSRIAALHVALLEDQVVKAPCHRHLHQR